VPVTDPDIQPVPVTVHGAERSTFVKGLASSGEPATVTGPTIQSVTGKITQAVPVTEINTAIDPVTVTGILARLADEWW